jgi:two-component sensor histidine kinase
MHAMSLVHHKLYMANQMDKIDMQEYVHELVSYLKGSFENNNKISYHLDVESFHLKVIGAVPVGLIINEAVTNAIKYAFSNQEKGSISIFMQKGLKDIVLKIADNGIGLSKGFDIDNSHSFGMTLINGLVKQLEGTLTIIDEEGLSLTIVFDSHHPIEIFEVEAG